ncbi:head completion/stabilization protein [Limnobaculum xujianqingii]|uniref:head completion/stabilization protein n=1 Tax=Limnobaculum xujianqingii TaxID=2738837 RepID=UPI001129CCE4|nr:head completion/stabilization protein [Limnobaculum xujianqingii]
MFKADNMEYDNRVITNNGFWPDITVGDFQRKRTIPPDVNHLQVGDYLVNAIKEINKNLSDYTAQMKAKGFKTAAEVTGDDGDPVMLGGENQLVIQYKKAVYARAKADLVPEYASLSRREAHIGQDSPQTKAQLLAESSFVLRSIKGLSRVGVSIV